MSFRDHGAQQCDVNAINRLKLAVEPQEMFELFINKLVFYESVSQRLNRWSCLAVCSLDTPLERNASLRIT